MKKVLFFIALFVSSTTIFAQTEEQPDYTKIRFRKKVKEYKKKKPKLQGLTVNKDLVREIVDVLAEPYYNGEEKNEIVEKIWLSFNDPKKFDMVYRDYAIRTLPNWSKKNFKGEIVLEPNPYLKDWSVADTELDYFKVALHRILMYQGLMGYGEDAKKTRESIMNIKYVNKYGFPQATKNDWTNSYLSKVAVAVKKKGLSVFITEGSNFEFMICKQGSEEELIDLLGKMRWKIVKL